MHIQLLKKEVLISVGFSNCSRKKPKLLYLLWLLIFGSEHEYITEEDLESWHGFSENEAKMSMTEKSQYASLVMPSFLCTFSGANSSSSSYLVLITVKGLNINT